MKNGENKKTGARTRRATTPSPAGTADSRAIRSEEISEAKRVGDALKKSEERYRAFIERSGEGIWRFELDEPIPVDLPADEQVERIFRLAYLAECNDAMARQYGLSSAR